MKSADGLLRIITCNNRARRQSIALALNVLGLIPPFSVTDGTEKERCLCRAMTIRKCFSWSLMSLDCDSKNTVQGYTLGCWILLQTARKLVQLWARSPILP